MDPSSQAFTYLAVLVSIIFGLATQQILLGYRNLILSKAGNRTSIPTLLWSVIVLLIIAQNWWESFGLAGRQNWTFLAFAMILIQAIIIFMLAAVIFPRNDSGEEIDLESHYWDQRKAIYATAILYVVSSPIRAFLVDGAILPALDWLYHAIFLILFVLLMFVKNTLVHRLSLTAILALFVSYIAIVTPVLGSG